MRKDESTRIKPFSFNIRNNLFNSSCAIIGVYYQLRKTLLFLIF